VKVAQLFQLVVTEPAMVMRIVVPAVLIVVVVLLFLFVAMVVVTELKTAARAV
jgi:hypothetical protein